MILVREVAMHEPGDPQLEINGDPYEPSPRSAMLPRLCRVVK